MKAINLKGRSSLGEKELVGKERRYMNPPEAPRNAVISDKLWHLLVHYSCLNFKTFDLTDTRSRGKIEGTSMGLSCVDDSRGLVTPSTTCQNMNSETTIEASYRYRLEDIGICTI